MRFGNLIMNTTGMRNIGDDVQILAIEHLYDYMGIKQEQRVRIPLTELANWGSEYVVLPIPFCLTSYNHDMCITQFSKKIIPVFLSFSVVADHLSDADVEYLKQFEPIGCRDQYTMELLRKYSIISYLNGCMTLTLPRRPLEGVYNKIFCVDLPDAFMKYLPDEIRDNAIFTSHHILSTDCPNGEEEKAREVYGEYRDSAKLIVTTLMHATLPSIAMGIPVVLVRSHPSFRLSIFDRYTHIYYPDEFDRINWNPKVVEYEDFKSKLLENAASQVMSAYNKYNTVFDISSCYEKEDYDRSYNAFESMRKTVQHIKDKYSPNEAFHYSLWCVTQTADRLYYFIKENYQNATLDGVVDSYRNVDFHGKKSQKMEWLKDHTDAECFVCTISAIPVAKRYFRELKTDNYFLCWDYDYTW